MKLIYEEETHVIEDVAYEVYEKMGCDCHKDEYQDCLESALDQRSVLFVSKRDISLGNKRHPIYKTYNPDLLCYGKILLELAAVKNIAPEHKVPFIKYLKKLDVKLGFLINFGSYPEVQIERFEF